MEAPFRTYQVHDFMPFYPSQEDPQFTEKLQDLDEFRSLVPPSEEAPPKRGGSYIHQLFGNRFVINFDRGINIDEPGTGKSCIIAQSAEQLKRIYLDSQKIPIGKRKSLIRRAYILIKNKNLEYNIKYQIICRCTDRIYDLKAFTKTSSGAAMKAAISRELRKWYFITTYGNFAKHVNKMGDEELSEFMSDVVVYVDEVHNLVTQKSLEERPSKKKAREKANEENMKNYQTINRAFHLGRRNKIFLFTATPMINSVMEINKVMNLILPLDRQMDLSEEALRTATLETLAPYFRGLIRYIRRPNVGIIDKYEGKQIPAEPGDLVQGVNANPYIYGVDMSLFQSKIYAEVVKQHGETKFSLETRQAVNYIFPDGSYGRKGYTKYIQKDGRPVPSLWPELRESLTLYEDEDRGLKKHSAKFARMVEICRFGYFDGGEIQNHHGVYFVYFPLLVRGSGAHIFALALEVNGYEKFELKGRLNSKTFRSGPCGDLDGKEEREGKDGKDEKYLREGKAYEREGRRLGLSKGRRYALLTGDTGQALINPIMETATSYNNRYGEILEVVIGTRVVRDGVNFSHGSAVIFSSPPWNQAGYIQARDRIFRATSHTVRLAELQKKIDAKTPEGKKPEKATFEISIYNMACLSAYKKAKNTIDVIMYLQGAEKHFPIAHVFNLMKRLAVDCYNNRQRNYYGLDYSTNCDYLPCRYECAVVPKRPATRAAGNYLYYAEERIKRYINLILRLLDKRDTLTFIQIDREYKNTLDPYILSFALNQMVNDPISYPVLNRFGEKRYLRQGPGEEYYLDRDPFLAQGYNDETYYGRALLGTQDPQQNLFDLYITGLNVEEEKEIIRRFERNEISYDEFKDVFDQLTLRIKVSLLERSLVLLVQGTSNALTSHAIKEFAHVTYILREPVSLITKVASIISIKPGQRGRKPKSSAEGISTKKQEEIKKLFSSYSWKDEKGSVVIIHMALKNESERVGYGKTSKFLRAQRRVRLFKPREGKEFREVNQVEYYSYQNYVSRNREERISEYAKFRVYGTIIEDKFRIHDLRWAPEAKGRKKVDRREIPTGRVCTFMELPKLYDILYFFKVPPPKIRGSPPSRREMLRKVEYLMGEDPTSEAIKYFYAWRQKNPSRTEICDILYDFFMKNGIMFQEKTTSTFDDDPKSRALLQEARIQFREGMENPPPPPSPEKIEEEEELGI
jgi:hypothetical protein